MNTPTNPIMEAAVVATEPATLPFEKLSADEIQELRRIIERNRTGRSKDFILPDLKITEEDKDRFADCLVTGQPFRETFERYKGKFKVTLRTHLKWEEDDIIEQIFLDFEDKYTRSDGQYANRLNVYHLCYQVEKLDGIIQVPPAKKANLREFAGKSIFEAMVEPKLYVLISLLGQFDAKVTALCRLATPPDFSSPAADS